MVVVILSEAKSLFRRSGACRASSAGNAPLLLQPQSEKTFLVR
jgi:hypothetical protein